MSTRPIPLQHIAHRGACGKTRVVPQNRRPKPESTEMRVAKMRVLLMTYGSRGDVEPMVGLAMQLRAVGAEVQVCAPPDFAELLDGVGVPLVPTGRPVRPTVKGAVTGSAPLPAAGLSQRAAA